MSRAFLSRRLARALAAPLLGACLLVQAAPVGDALDRAALPVRRPASALLLAGAVTGQRLVAVGERGLVVWSDDAGRQWKQAAVPVSVTLTALRFVDAQHAIAVGHAGTVLTSDDRGERWTRRLDGRQAAQLALQAARARGDATALQVAEQLVADGPDKPFLDVALRDAQRALVVGAYGLAFATEDAGRTWTPWIDRLDNPRGLHLYAVRVQGERIVMAGEQGLVLQSLDGGRTFSRLETPYKGSFFTLELPAAQEILLAGLRGNVWRSTDGGRQWLQVALPAPTAVTGSVLRPDGSVLLTNQSGLVLAGRDGRFAPLKLPPMPPLNAVVLRPDGGLLALSVQGALSLPLAPAP